MPRLMATLGPNMGEPEGGKQSLEITKRNGLSRIGEQASEEFVELGHLLRFPASKAPKTKPNIPSMTTISWRTKDKDS